MSKCANGSRKKLLTVTAGHAKMTTFINGKWPTAKEELMQEASILRIEAKEQREKRNVGRILQRKREATSNR